MKRHAFAMMLLITAGCAGGRGVKPQPASPLSPSQQLSSAVEALGKGEAPAARKLLTAASEGTPQAGVTDEVLFRLALLSVKSGGDSPQAQQLLRRLKKEYPGSPWTAQAQPLAEQLTAHEDLRRQNKAYRAAKDALLKENGELKMTVEQLNKNIEQLKRLDLELEKSR